MLYEVITEKVDKALEHADELIVKARGAGSNTRITSYNVCYTKLLRYRYYFICKY